MIVRFLGVTTLIMSLVPVASANLGRTVKHLSANANVVNSVNPGEIVACWDGLSHQTRVEGVIQEKSRDFMLSQFCDLKVDPSLAQSKFHRSDAFYAMDEEDQSTEVEKCKVKVKEEMFGLRELQAQIELATSSMEELSEQQKLSLGAVLKELGINNGVEDFIAAADSIDTFFNNLIDELFTEEIRSFRVSDDSGGIEKLGEHHRALVLNPLKAYHFKNWSDDLVQKLRDMGHLDNYNKLEIDGVTYYQDSFTESFPGVIASLQSAEFGLTEVRISASNGGRSLGASTDIEFVNLQSDFDRFFTVIDSENQGHIIRFHGEGEDAEVVKTFEVEQGEVEYSTTASHMDGIVNQELTYKVKCKYIEANQ